MLFFIKLLKKFLKIINGSSAPWQVFLGVFLGVLLGFMPLWPRLAEPAPLGLAVFAVAIVVNCHFGSVLLFWGLGSLFALALKGPALAIGTTVLSISTLLLSRITAINEFALFACVGLFNFLAILRPFVPLPLLWLALDAWEELRRLPRRDADRPRCCSPPPTRPRR